MNHTFEMKLGELNVEVSGDAWKGEPATMVCPHSDPEFLVQTIEHNGSHFDLDDLSESAILKIERAALKSMQEVQNEN